MATMTARKPKAKPTQLMAVSEIMLTATAPMTLKEIAKKTARKTGKPASEAAVSARLRDLRKPTGANLNVVRTAGPTKGVFLYEVLVKRSDVVASPAGPVNAIASPARRPITFGRPASNVSDDKVGVDKIGFAPVAGSRSALSFAESLTRSENQPNG